MNKILITGGAGYVGSNLVPKLLNKGYQVTVVDLFLYGKDVLDGHKNLSLIQGDIRDQELLLNVIPGHDAVIHLACISNDPSFELNPTLGKTINLDAFEPMVKISKTNGVKRFIYASSASVYGIKNIPNVTEDVELEPLTDYSKFKAECEQILKKYQDENFICVTIRPATVCGYSRRLRLDLTVNILTNLAYNKGQITVFGGEQKRPNLHIEDMTDLYTILLEKQNEEINGKTYNVGYENFKVSEIAKKVKSVIGENIKILTTPSNDDRSYHISSEKIKNELGFVPKHSIEEAVSDLKTEFDKGNIPNSLEDIRYFNVKLMNEISLK